MDLQQLSLQNSPHKEEILKYLKDGGSIKTLPEQEISVRDKYTAQPRQKQQETNEEETDGNKDNTNGMHIISILS